MQQSPRTIFFDLDGTLHKQDMFGAYLRFVLAKNCLNHLLLLPLLPVIFFGFVLGGYAARWPMSLFLWASTFGHSQAKIEREEAAFCVFFRQRVIPFPVVRERLQAYLSSENTEVWLITGSPRTLVEKVYFDADFFPHVKLLASQMTRGCGGRVLSVRCVGEEKVELLKQHHAGPLQLYSGYSDSPQDNPLLAYCQYRWRVTASGELNSCDATKRNKQAMK